MPFSEVFSLLGDRSTIALKLCWCFYQDSSRLAEWRFQRTPPALAVSLASNVTSDQRLIDYLSQSSQIHDDRCSHTHFHGYEEYR